MSLRATPDNPEKFRQRQLDVAIAHLEAFAGALAIPPVAVSPEMLRVSVQESIAPAVDNTDSVLVSVLRTHGRGQIIKRGSEVDITRRLADSFSRLGSGLSLPARDKDASPLAGLGQLLKDASLGAEVLDLEQTVRETDFSANELIAFRSASNEGEPVIVGSVVTAPGLFTVLSGSGLAEADRGFDATGTAERGGFAVEMLFLDTEHLN